MEASTNTGLTEGKGQLGSEQERSQVWNKDQGLTREVKKDEEDKGHDSILEYEQVTV